jgi:hypothetical protein
VAQGSAPPVHETSGAESAVPGNGLLTVEITPHVEAVRGDLQAVGGGDDGQVVDRLTRALESSLQLRFLDAIGEAALELNPQLPTGHVDVRLAGRDVQLVFVAEQEAAAGTPPTDEEGGTARLTLRMAEGLKSRVEAAAAAEGISTNAWLVRSISRALEPRREIRRTGSRITGYARS